MTSGDVWACPSDIGETFPQGSFGYHRRTPPWYKWFRAKSSYLWFGRGFNPPTIDLACRAATSIRKPTQTIMLLEGRPWHGHYHPDDAYEKSPGRYNVLYCDGHIAQRTAAQHMADEAEAYP